MIIEKNNMYYKKIYEYPRNLPSEYISKLQNWHNDKINKLNLKEKKQIPKKQMINKMFDMGTDIHYITYHMKLITMDIIINKNFTFKCIESGNIFKTQKCFHITFQNENVLIEQGLDDIIVYIFDNIENPFFVCVGGGGYGGALFNQIYLIYYLKKNKIYSFNETNLSSNESKIKLCKKIIQHYNNNKINACEQVCTSYGYLSNIGHTYWNELSAFHFLVDMDLLKFIHTFIIGPYDYYNIYDYLKKNNYNVIREGNIENINNTVMKSNSLIFKYSDWFMYDDLKSFVLENNKLTDTTELLYIENVKNTFYPIITFNIRGVFRNLYKQEESLTNIINSLLLLFPNMFVIFDGYIKNENVNLNNCATEEGNLVNQNIYDDSYHNIVNTIIQHIKTTNYISLIGTTLDRELAWLDISQYGLMQLGAGAFNHTWLMNKKGLFVGRNIEINEDLLIHTWHDFYLRENKDLTNYINPKLVKFDISKKKEFYIDWHILFIYMLRDILILEKNNYHLSQLDNFKKYNIYMRLGLGNNITCDNFLKMNFYDAVNSLKKYINTNM